MTHWAYHKMKGLLYILMLLMSVSCISCSTFMLPNNSIDPNVLATSENLANGLKSQYGMLDFNDSRVVMVNNVSQRMLPIIQTYLRENGKDNLLPRYEIVVLNDENNVDCYGIGGGVVIMHSGLLNYLSSEEEIAIMVTHELAHEIYQHSYKKLNSSLISQLGSTLILGTVSDEDKYKQLYLSAFGATSSAFGGMKFSDKDDKEADKLAMKLISKAGYNPMVVVSLIEKLEQLQDSGKKLTLLQIHPYTRTKREEIQKSAQKYYDEYYLPAISGQQPQPQVQPLPPQQPESQPETPPQQDEEPIKPQDFSP